MSKTIKIILIFLAVAGVVGAGVYFGTRTDQVAGVPTGTDSGATLPSGQTGETSELPIGENGSSSEATGGNLAGEDVVTTVLGSKILYKEPILGFSPVADGGVILVTQKGVVASVSTTGETRELNNSEIENPLEVVFSNDGKKILLTYGKITAPQFSVYDVASSTWQPILANTTATIRPKTHEVVYLYEKMGTKNLFIWDLDKPKTTPQQISSLQIEDPILSWRDKDTLLINSRPSAYIKNTIIAFNLSKKTAIPLIKDEYALSVVWNDLGSMGLAFYGNETYRGGNLRIRLAGGEESSKLTVTTLAEKCSFFHPRSYFEMATTSVVKTKVATSTSASTTPTHSQNELYCAFPRDTKAFESAILPDEYYRGSLVMSDDLVKINLDDGSLGYVFSPTEAQMDIYKPFSGENEIYFINRNNNFLYSVPNR